MKQFQFTFCFLLPFLLTMSLNPSWAVFHVFMPKLLWPVKMFYDSLNKEPSETLLEMQKVTSILAPLSQNKTKGKKKEKEWKREFLKREKMAHSPPACQSRRLTYCFLPFSLFLFPPLPCTPSSLFSLSIPSLFSSCVFFSCSALVTNEHLSVL